MANELIIKNIQNGNVEKYIKNKGITNNNEIQKFKSNVLAIANQDGLDNASPETIVSACYKAVLINLPLEKNFGYCGVVPRNVSYKDKNGDYIKNKEAQFQMGYKGYIQLALRSQQYKDINVIEVRQGEIKKIDRLKGIKFNGIQNDLERLKTPIIGYVASFKLRNGFYKELYGSKEQMEKHFLTGSETYKKIKNLLSVILRVWLKKLY